MAENAKLIKAIGWQERMLEYWSDMRKSTESDIAREAYQESVDRCNITLDALREKHERENKVDCHLFFKQRMQLSAVYLKWIAENNILDCSLSVITFLEANGLLNREKCWAFIEESEGKHEQ